MENILETERLFIRYVVEEDSAFIYELMNTSSWIQFIGDRKVYSLEAAKNYINTNIRKSYVNIGFGMFKMVSKELNKPLGLCGLLQRDYLDNIDIGFATLPQFEGRGYTYEAAKAIMKYGFNTLKKEKILGITIEENLKSRKLLEKLGLKHVGMVKTSSESEEIMLYST